MRRAWIAHRLDARLQRSDRVRRGLRDLLLLGLVYGVVIALLGIGGMAPWLAIPSRDYFLWEPLFTVPAFFLCGLLAAAVLQLLARSRGGRGTFEDTLSLIGPVTLWCTLFTLVPDALIALGLLLGVIDPQQWMTDIVHPSPTLALVWTYLLLYVAAFLIGYPMIARKVHHLSRPRARWCGWAAFLVYQAMLFVFIR